MPAHPRHTGAVLKKKAILLAVGAIVLALVLLVIWPASAPEKAGPFNRWRLVLKPQPVHTAMEIDPPFGFHWGDSTSRVEALLGYSGARIVSRQIQGNGEFWNVEGLIQPGLKNSRFFFQNNSLCQVELRCQYDAWSLEQYKKRLEELRAFFDAKYHGSQQSTPIISPAQNNSEQLLGYGWRFQNTNLKIFCRSLSNRPGSGFSVTDLIMHYRGDSANKEPDTDEASGKRWLDQIDSPLLAAKWSTEPDTIPAGSVLAITEAKILNTSQSVEAAFVLSIAVKLRPDTTIDSTRAVVQVSFYDTTPGRQIVLTDADVNYNWESHRDWKENNPETLTASYIRPRDQTMSSERKFFGYIAAVYYDGKLQSVRADPLKLLNLFPVRTFISPFESAQDAAGRGDFVSAARLYQRAADRGNLFALENLAWFYAHGKGVEQDYHKAALFYERAALQHTPRALNALAWFLATCPDDSVRDGREAIRQATNACELTYWQEWKSIDTLAAAWAEIGDFKQAIAYQQLALEANGVDQEARQKMEKRLDLYRKQRPIRE
jgi:hypothetical protein